MRYTEAQKARIRGMIEAFEGAQQHLAAAVSTGSGICHALDIWAVSDLAHYRSRRDARDDARGLIQRALQGCAYLENWQRLQRSGDQGGAPRVTFFAPRKRWLDQLIADCRAAL